MKKFLCNTSAFIGLSILLYPLLVFAWGFTLHPRLHPNLQYLKGAYGHQYTRINEVSATENVDVLVVGSSHAYRGFDPRIFKEKGIELFNLGSSSQSHIQTGVLLKNYLDQLNPKLVLYEVYPPVFWSDGVESSLDVLANDNVNIHSVKMAVQLNHIKTYNALFYNFFIQQLDLDKDFVEPGRVDDDRYIAGGYVEKDLAYYKPDSLLSFSWKIKPEQIKAFKENLEFIQKSGADVLLIKAPITQARYIRARNNRWFDSTMTAKGNYINFNETLKLTDSLHFYDEHHLNQDGVEIFNRDLIRRLKDGEKFKSYFRRAN